MARKTSSILANLGIAVAAAIVVFCVSNYLVQRDAAAAAAAAAVAKKEGFQVTNSGAVSGILIAGMVLGVLVAVAGAAGIKMLMGRFSQPRGNNMSGVSNVSNTTY